MKKMIFSILMMLTMIMMPAKANENAATMMHITVNTEVLSKALQANKDQAEAVSTVMNLFDMQTATIAAEDNSNVRKKMMDNAIRENVKLMYNILNREQMKVYLTLLNITLANRGIR